VRVDAGAVPRVARGVGSESWLPPCRPAARRGADRVDGVVGCGSPSRLRCRRRRPSSAERGATDQRCGAVPCLLGCWPGV